MTTNGLPERGPGGANTLGDQPQLPARTGGRTPFVRPERDAEDVFPGREATETIRSPTIETPFVPTVTAGAVPEEGPAPLPQILIPNSFDEMAFHAQLLAPAREVSTVIEQTIAPSGTGTVTVTIPINTVDITRTFREGGDGSVTYRLEIDGAGRNAIVDHRITGGERQFSRFWEKYLTVAAVFTNNDAVNSALLQIEWISLQLNSVVWLAYRTNLRQWSRLLGISEV